LGRAKVTTQNGGEEEGKDIHLAASDLNQKVAGLSESTLLFKNEARHVFVLKRKEPTLTSDGVFVLTMKVRGYYLSVLLASVACVCAHNVTDNYLDAAAEEITSSGAVNGTLIDIDDSSTPKDEAISSAEPKPSVDEVSKLKKELAAALEELNDSIELAKSLQNKIERMELDHIKELNETFNELESVSKMI
jgi:hypothetical protein